MRPFLSHLLTLFPRPYFAPMQVNCGYHVLVPEHMCEHARAVTTFGFWALNCPCCGHPWKNHNGKNCMNVSERVRTCPNVSDRVPRSDNLGLLIWLVSFGSLIWPRNMPYSASCTSIWFHIPSTLWISIGSAVMQVLSVVRLDRIVTVGKKKVSVNIFCDFIWFLWHGSHPRRTSRNYSFNFSLQHP